MAAWWEGLFGAEAWQRVQRGWSTIEDTPDQAARAIEALGLEAGARVLDAPCGDGRVGLELAAAGLEVVGVDLVAAFVEAGREAARRRGLEERVELRVADVREPVGEEGFDAAVCMWGSFGYFDEAGNLAQARAAAEALRPGGRYLIDTASVETVLPRFRERTWFRVGDTVVLEERTFALGTGRVETEHTFLRDGAPAESRRSSVRLYTVHELTELLREAGFGSFELRDDALEPFDVGSERLWLVATKG